MNVQPNQEATALGKTRFKIARWQKYLFGAVVLNSLVWGAVYAYLEFLPPTYISKWAVIVLGPDAGVKISINDVGQAQSDQGDRPQSFQDPRSDYVYIFESFAVLDRVAQKMDMSVDDFGEPEITTDKESALISFEVEGETPEQAQEKSRLLYQFWSDAIEKLRQAELQRRQKISKETLGEARRKLDDAQRNLARYQFNSGFSSEEQIKDLSVNIEQLRRKKAELTAEEDGINKKVQQLSKDVNYLSDQEVRDAYLLEADQVYAEHFEQYAAISGELINLSSQLGSQHPQVIEKKAQLEKSQAMLLERASYLLNRPVDQRTLLYLNSLILDPKAKTTRQELFKELVTTRAEKESISSQKQQLDRQISLLENRLQGLSQKQLTVKKLEVDYRLAEAVFTATLADVDVADKDIDSIYPPLQLVLEPTLPDEDDPTSPDSDLAILGGIASSLLLTTGVLLLWWEMKSPWVYVKKWLED